MDSGMRSLGGAEQGGPHGRPQAVTMYPSVLICTLGLLGPLWLSVGLEVLEVGELVVVEVLVSRRVDRSTVGDGGPGALALVVAAGRRGSPKNQSEPDPPRRGHAGTIAGTWRAVGRGGLCVAVGLGSDACVALLIESLSRLASRVEILARGVEGDRVSAERMLERQRPLDAREHARAILMKVPGSPLGLALWADAAERAWLDSEVVEALEELAQAVPWRADVWLRLGRAGMRLAHQEEDGEERGARMHSAREALERAASAPDERAASRLALLDLCDLDLAAGDPARALRWLERVAAPVTLAGGPPVKDEAVILRRAEAALATGRMADAKELAEQLSDTLGDAAKDPVLEEERVPGRRALLRARLADNEPAGLEEALRAFILDVPGSRDVLSRILGTTRDAKLLHDARAIVAGAGAFEDPSFVAAFAVAEGRRADALVALVRAVEKGDAHAGTVLMKLGVEARDATALAALARREPNPLPRVLRRVLAATEVLERNDPEAALKAADEAADAAQAPAWEGAVSADPDLLSWIDELRTSAFVGLAKLPKGASWPVLLDTLRAEARDLSSTQAMLRIEGLGSELERPIVVAIVGEFNAGKSTFINAFLGVDVAPTGILPTTATLHRVAWAPDTFARVLVQGGADRVVSHAALKATLAEMQSAGVEIDRVQIYAPIERLRWVEILDTPGFNAPNPEHARAALRAFDEVHAVLWLLDLTGPLKATEAEILKQVHARGLPIIVLCNKLDRLSESDLEKVLTHTREGLAEIGIEVAAGPLPFSAKLALAGRTGDPAALSRSRWKSVEDELSRTVVDRADSLRERALRRRAATIASDLAEVASSRGAEQAAAAAALSKRAAGLRTAAAELSRNGDALIAQVTEVLAEPIRGLESDLLPLAQIPENARDEKTIVAYAAPRAVARLAHPASRAFSKALGVQETQLGGAFISAALEGCIVASAVSGEQRVSGTLMKAAARAFHGALEREAFDLEATAPRVTAERRLRSLAKALSSKFE